jgi:hypothetical protein
LKNEIFSQLLSVFCWRCTNAVNFSLCLLDKSMWMHSTRKGIFNIKLGYYTCKRKVVSITYIIWVYCCGFEGSLLPWSYVSMIYIAVQSASMIVYLFVTRSWSSIIGTKQPKVNQFPQVIGIKQPKADKFPQQWQGR